MSVGARGIMNEIPRLDVCGGGMYYMSYGYSTSVLDWSYHGLTLTNHAIEIIIHSMIVSVNILIKYLHYLHW